MACKLCGLTSGLQATPVWGHKSSELAPAEPPSRAIYLHCSDAHREPCPDTRRFITTTLQQQIEEVVFFASGLYSPPAPAHFYEQSAFLFYLCGAPGPWRDYVCGAGYVAKNRSFTSKVGHFSRLSNALSLLKAISVIHTLST